MRSHFALGRIAGIEVGLHYTWFIIALMIFLSLAQMLQLAWPQRSPWELWALAGLTAAGFFGCLLLHELAHAAMARRRGVPVDAITLFALGGVSHAGKESPDASSEFLIGVVGPLTSLALGLACLGLAGLFSRSPAQAALSWLGSINLGLALFNLAPGFPLDGGRVLRALVWAWTGSLDKATKTAGAAGQALALLLILAGVTRFFAAPASGGLWLALLGVFLLEASGASILQVDLRRLLTDVPVRDVMRRDVPVVDEEQDLETFAAQAGRPLYLVQHHGIPAGVITPREVAQARRRRQRGSVGEAMVRLDRVPFVDASASGWDALETLSREHVPAVAVREGGAVAGVVSQDDLVQAVRTRRELQPSK